MKHIKRIRIPTEAEDAAIRAAAKSDPDCPPLSEEQLSDMVPAAKVPDRVARMQRLASGNAREVRSDGAVRFVAISEEIAERLTRHSDDLEGQVDEALRKIVGL